MKDVLLFYESFSSGFSAEIETNLGCIYTCLNEGK